MHYLTVVLIPKTDRHQIPNLVAEQLAPWGYDSPEKFEAIDWRERKAREGTGSPGYEVISEAVEEPPSTTIDDIDDEFSEDGGDGKYDWYQLGGRFTGYFTDYNPNTDPKNVETCGLCEGTGMRNDEMGQKTREQNPDYKCNG